MSHIVHITTRAANDIDENVVWWAENRSTEQASRWYHGIKEFIDSLSVIPESRPLISEDVKSSFETREAYFGLSGRKTHRIVFQIQSDFVEVVTVRHLAQDELSVEDLR